MFLKKLMLLVGIAGLLVMASAGTALAGNPHGVTLSAVKKTAVNYTSCYNATTGTALPCVALEITISNNTKDTANCDVNIREENSKQVYTVVSFGDIASGQSNSYVIVNGFNGYKRLSLDLSCNGSVINGETSHIHVSL